MFIVVRHRVLPALALVLSLAAAAHSLFSLARPVFSPAERIGRPVYVLDAGHGGEDGGAVSAGGVRESDINLAIVRDLNALLQFLGKATVLTRSDDVSVYSEGAETLRQKKTSDLKNRVALVNTTPNAILLSIHQNSLPSAPSVCGAQVFHAASEASAVLASAVQSVLNGSVNAGNEKHEKKIDSSIFLMKNVTCPAILIECGFLSNAAEAERLTEPDYQKALCVAIVAGALSADIAQQGREAP